LKERVSNGSSQFTFAIDFAHTIPHQNMLIDGYSHSHFEITKNGKLSLCHLIMMLIIDQPYLKLKHKCMFVYQRDLVMESNL